MKRKVTVASVALIAALTLGACSSPEADAVDPQSVLEQTGNSANPKSSSDSSDPNKVDPNTLVSGEGDVDYVEEEQNADDVEVTEGGEEDYEAYREGETLMGINPDEVEVPEVVAEHFSEQADVSDTTRVVRDALYAIEHGMINITFQAEPFDSQQKMDLMTNYVSEILTSGGLEAFEDSLDPSNNEVTIWKAWYLLPFRTQDGMLPLKEGDMKKIASSDYNWHSEIKDVRIEGVVSYETGDNRDGVVVSMDRSYYVPIEDGSQALTFNMIFNVIMVPDGFGKWIISDWYSYDVQDSMIVEIEG